VHTGVNGSGYGADGIGLKSTHLLNAGGISWRENANLPSPYPTSAHVLGPELRISLLDRNGEETAF
jgi:hypothetical protein